MLNGQSHHIDKGIDSKEGERFTTRLKDPCSKPDCFAKVSLKN